MQRVALRHYTIIQVPVRQTNYMYEGPRKLCMPSQAAHHRPSYSIVLRPGLVMRVIQPPLSLGWHGERCPGPPKLFNNMHIPGELVTWPCKSPLLELKRKSKRLLHMLQFIILFDIMLSHPPVLHQAPHQGKC